MTAKYSIRTCTECGIRKPQPEMVRVKTYREVGKSQGTVSATTIGGLLLGSKSARRSIERAIFNTSQRTYKRKVTVWSCGDCVDNIDVESQPFNSVLGFIVLIILGIAFLMIFGTGIM